MQLAELWFMIIAICFIAYVFFEGFDFGVGMGTKFLAIDEREKRLLISIIGPHWDGNEVWLLTAGGAMFAAFPHWYATLFSGYYMAFVLLLLALIVRGVSFEFRSKVNDNRWKATWDWSIFLGSILPPFLLGALFAGLIQGLPIDGNMEMHAAFFGDIVNLYTIMTGITFVLITYILGLTFIALKTDGPIRERAREQAKKIYWWVGAAIILFLALTAMETTVFADKGTILIPVFAVAVVLYALLYVFLRKDREGYSFVLSALVAVLITASFFIYLFPNALIATDPTNNITIYDAASGGYSLTVMTIVAAIFVPIVLVYTAWSYWIFRRRMKTSDHLEY